MPKFPKTPETTTFQRRTGADPFGASGWRGVNTESDPGALEANQLLWGLNCRLSGSEILSRPGQQFMVSLRQYGPLAWDPTLLGCIEPVMWMNEAPVANPHVRLWYTCLGCFGAQTGPGASIMHIDPSENPVVQPYARFLASANKQVPIGGYGDALLVGDKAMLREMVQLSSHPSIPASEMAPSPPATPLASWPGYTATCLLAFDGKLFIGLSSDSAPTTASKIVTWNGISLQDDLTGIRAPLAFGILRNTLVCGFDATAGHVRVRQKGDSPSAWATVAGGGFQCATQGNAMCEVADKLFIAGGNDKIFSFDGSNLVLARTVPGCATDGKGVTALARINGLLHYGWNTPTAYAARIGRYDADSTANLWVDTYKDLTTQIAGFTQLSSLAAYRQQLYAGGNSAWVVACAAGDIPGTAEIVANPSPGPGFQVLQLLSYPDPL